VPNEVHLALKLIKGMTAEFDPAKTTKAHWKDPRCVAEAMSARPRCG
jgi:hypothetical protein